MDVHKTLRELYEEKRRLDLVIASLEARLQLMQRKSARSRRGRKGMSDEERKRVSLRMVKYWEDRKAQAAKAEPPSHPTGTAPD